MVFLLLIFFMIAGNLTATEPFEVEPPASNSGEAHEPDPAVILMGMNGRFAYDNEALTRAQVLERIGAMVDKNPKARITLKVDERLSGNQLVRFTRALYKAGVEKLRLLTLPIPA